MQISFAALALLLAASGASAQTTISKPAPGFVQAGAGPSYTKDVPLFAPSSIPNSQPTGSNNNSNNKNNNAAATPSSAAQPLAVPAVAGAGVLGALAVFLL